MKWSSNPSFHYVFDEMFQWKLYYKSQIGPYSTKSIT